jgi:uncharacterized protein YsxB (DUF464 family)
VITINAVVDRRGALFRLDMSGHASVASGPRGGNTVCAGVTAVVRSCAEAIVRNPGIVSVGSATEGELHLEVTRYADSEVEWLRGATSVLASGVGRIGSESPDEVDFRLVTEGEQHGS